MLPGQRNKAKKKKGRKAGQQSQNIEGVTSPNVAGEPGDAGAEASRSKKKAGKSKRKASRVRAAPAHDSKNIKIDNVEDVSASKWCTACKRRYTGPPLEHEERWHVMSCRVVYRGDSRSVIIARNPKTTMFACQRCPAHFEVAADMERHTSEDCNGCRRGRDVSQEVSQEVKRQPGEIDQSPHDPHIEVGPRPGDIITSPTRRFLAQRAMSSDVTQTAIYKFLRDCGGNCGQEGKDYSYLVPLFQEFGCETEAELEVIFFVGFKVDHWFLWYHLSRRHGVGKWEWSFIKFVLLKTRATMRDPHDTARSTQAIGDLAVYAFLQSMRLPGMESFLPHMNAIGVCTEQQLNSYCDNHQGSWDERRHFLQMNGMSMIQYMCLWEALLARRNSRLLREDHEGVKGDEGHLVR